MDDQERKLIPVEHAPISEQHFIAGSLPESQALLILFALVSSNLFALLLGWLFEFLSLRGVVNVAASRLMLLGAWGTGVLIVCLWAWGTNIKAKIPTTFAGALLLAAMLWGLDAWAPKPVAANAKPDVAPAPGPKEPPPSAPNPRAAVPEVTITAPPDFIYNLTWIPKKDMTPRTTLGANYDQPYLEIRKLPLWPPVSVVAVTADWSVVGESTKSIFLGSSHFASFAPTVGADGGPGSMFQIGASGPSLAVSDTIQISLDHVSDDPEKMNIPPQFWNGFILRMLALQKRPRENVPPEGMWKDKMTLGTIALKYRAGDIWYTRNFRVEVAVDAMPDGAWYAGFTIPSVEPEFRSPDDLRAMMKLVSTRY